VRGRDHRAGVDGVLRLIGVLAVLGLHDRDRFGAVSGEREVTPLPREQLARAGDQADAANDQTPS